MVYSPFDKTIYGYHISDNKKHDSIFTELVTADLLDHFPDALDYPPVRKKSDNCSVQYCSKHVFEAELNLSKQINKPIILILQGKWAR